MMAATARFLMVPGQSHRTLFAQREIASPGPAFEVLYAGLWSPGIALAAALIARTLGQTAVGQDTLLRAVMLISSLIGLGQGETLVARGVRADDLAETTIAILGEQIDGWLALGEARPLSSARSLPPSRQTPRSRAPR